MGHIYFVVSSENMERFQDFFTIATGKSVSACGPGGFLTVLYKFTF